MNSLFAAWATLLGGFALGVTVTGAQTNAPPWPMAKPGAIARWQAMRFGMFVHFGPVSLTGHEIGWSRGRETPVDVYDSLYHRFNPTNFSADAWVKAAKTAGMKYLVLTTKHHDGFCLWDTKCTDYSIAHTPFRRDIVDEVARACRQQGLAFGAYYSTCDWHHPGFPVTSPGGTVKREKSDLDAYNRYLLAQVTELITRYGPLVTIWNDVPQFFEGRGAQTIKLARALQPDILLNDRTGDGGDYDTPEQRIGKYQDNRPWETCMTICEQWSWKPNDRLKSLAQCVRALVLCAGGDGNLLLNVGPMPTGEIEPRQVQRLSEIGAWLETHGESIYRTRGGPWKPNRSLAATRAGRTVYLHLLTQVSDMVVLPDLSRRVVRASLLNGTRIPLTQKDGKLILTVPSSGRESIDTIVKLQLDGSAMDLPAQEVPQDNRAATEPPAMPAGELPPG